MVSFGVQSPASSSAPPFFGLGDWGGVGWVVKNGFVIFESKCAVLVYSVQEKHHQWTTQALLSWVQEESRHGGWIKKQLCWASHLQCAHKGSLGATCIEGIAMGLRLVLLPVRNCPSPKGYL